MKSRILLFGLILALLSSCATQRRCSIKYPPQGSKDSIYIETVTEKPVYIPGDSIFVEAPVINCPDQELIKFENSKLKQEISIIKGKLISNTIIKPDTVFIPVIETKIVTKEVIVPEPVKFIPQIYKIALWLWVGIFIAGLGYVLIRLFVLRR